MARYQMAQAWLACYFATFTIQELKKDKVLLTTEQFGEGETKSYQQSQIDVLRERYLRNAEILIGKLQLRGK